MIPRPIGDGAGGDDNGVGMATTLSSPSASTSSHLVSGNLRTNKDNTENAIICDCKLYLLP
jgi:heterodisulfide reductase subunit B